MAKKGGGWITINGTHVLIDGSGKIVGGPARLTGGGSSGSSKSISERNKPKVKSAEEFDKYVKENNLSTMYRGYSAKDRQQLTEYKESHKNGTVLESGEKTSALGKGVYFSTSKSEADGYMRQRKHEKNERYGAITTAALDVGAKSGNYNDLKIKKSKDESDLIEKAFNAKEQGDTKRYNEYKDKYYSVKNQTFEDYARLNGYHAIVETGTGYIVVLEQKALVIRDD